MLPTNNPYLSTTTFWKDPGIETEVNTKCLEPHNEQLEEPITQRLTSTDYKKIEGKGSMLSEQNLGIKNIFLQQITKQTQLASAHLLGEKSGQLEFQYSDNLGTNKAKQIPIILFNIQQMKQIWMVLKNCTRS